MWFNNECGVLLRDSIDVVNNECGVLVDCLAKWLCAS